MNGRVSVDPFIQGVGNSQGINPYSYVMNNPMSGTDPTGYKIENETKPILDSRTGAGVRSRGTITTTTVTDDVTGEVTNVTTATVMKNGNFLVKSTNYSNGKAESATIAGGNYKAGTGASSTFDIGSQEQIAKPSTGAAPGSSGGSFSASWCYQGACRTGVAYDLDVRSLDEIDQGLENLNSYMSMVAGAFSLPSIVRSFFTKVTKSTDKLPNTRAALDADLTEKGFKFKSVSQKNGYTTYKGPDGKTVTVKPTGEVIPVQKVWKSDGSGKFPQRQDYNGNPLPDQSHSTGHFVEPLVGPFKGNN